MSREAFLWGHSSPRKTDPRSGDCPDPRASFFRAGALQAIPWLVWLLAVALILRLGIALSIGLWLRRDYLIVPYVIGAITWGTYRFLRPWSASALMALTMSLAFTMLFGVWLAGVTDGLTIAGLFPYSDSQGSFADSLHLLHGRKFSEFSSRRPLFSAFMSGMLGITGLDLRLALCILTGMASLAIGCAVREVQRTMGGVPGALVGVCLFMFYCRLIGSTLTEQDGLTFGCIAFALIWRAAVKTRPGPALCGLFFLSLALNARAGAFFILPAIALWALWTFRTRKGSGLRILGGCTAAILLGFAVNGIILSQLGIPGAAYSNFSYSLYGLVYDGSWGSTLQQHPELAILPPVEQTSRVYMLAWEHIRTNATVLISGAARAWIAFFYGEGGKWPSLILHQSRELADAWVTLRTQGIAVLSQPGDLGPMLDVIGVKIWMLWLNILLITGVIVAWRYRQHPLAQLAMFGWTGILLSVPFVPPWDADNLRAYAATLPFVVALPSIGVLFDSRDPLISISGAASREHSRMRGVLVFGALLLVLQITVPPHHSRHGSTPPGFNGGEFI